MLIEKEFEVNEFKSLKLEHELTNIYVGGELFRQCKFLLLNISIDKVSTFDEITSIDEAAEKLDMSMEGIEPVKLKIPHETEFWGHCSNLQVWTEMNYDTRLLHRNLAFPLLKKLVELGDPIAKRVFKEEIAQRIENGNINVAHFLLMESYLQFFEKDELSSIFSNRYSPLMRNLEEKVDDKIYFNIRVFDILKKISYMSKFAKKLYENYSIKALNNTEFDTFFYIMYNEAIWTVRGGYSFIDSYWKFLTTASINFFNNLTRILEYDENKLKEDFGYEEAETALFMSNEVIKSTEFLPSKYLYKYIRKILKLYEYEYESNHKLQFLLRYVSTENLCKKKFLDLLNGYNSLRLLDILVKEGDLNAKKIFPQWVILKYIELEGVELDDILQWTYFDSLNREDKIKFIIKAFNSNNFELIKFIISISIGFFNFFKKEEWNIFLENVGINKISQIFIKIFAEFELWDNIFEVINSNLLGILIESPIINLIDIMMNLLPKNEFMNICKKIKNKNPEHFRYKLIKTLKAKEVKNCRHSLLYINSLIFLDEYDIKELSKELGSNNIVNALQILFKRCDTIDTYDFLKSDILNLFLKIPEIDLVKIIIDSKDNIPEEEFIKFISEKEPELFYKRYGNLVEKYGLEI